MANYAKASKTTLKLITKNGRSVQMVKYGTDPDDPNRPWHGSGNAQDTTITVTAVFIDPVSEKDLGDAEVLDPHTSVKRGKKMVLIAAAENLDEDGVPLDLLEYDQLIDGSRAYTIEKIDLLAPGGTPLMYEAKLER